VSVVHQAFEAFQVTDIDNTKLANAVLRQEAVGVAIFINVPAGNGGGRKPFSCHNNWLYGSA
jgi:hypothetical protein